MEKKFHSSTLKKSIRISTSPEKAWTNISKIAQLQWLDGIKSSKFLSEKTRGIGATRRISFLDGIGKAVKYENHKKRIKAVVVH